jgi:hypothetical protein
MLIIVLSEKHLRVLVDTSTIVPAQPQTLPMPASGYNPRVPPSRLVQIHRYVTPLLMENAGSVVGSGVHHLPFQVPGLPSPYWRGFSRRRQGSKTAIGTTQEGLLPPGLKTLNSGLFGLIPDGMENKLSMEAFGFQFVPRKVPIQNLL